MLTLGPLAFASPWLLLGLTALPAIWWLLRVSPPLPKRVRFPAIRLLVGLVREEETPAHTPLWLLLLRLAIAALVIFALAEPVWNPAPRIAGTGPLLIVTDNGWAAASHWNERRAAMESSDDEQGSGGGHGFGERRWEQRGGQRAGGWGGHGASRASSMMAGEACGGIRERARARSSQPQQFL